MDPVVLFFVLGLIGSVFKSDLKIPASFYTVLSIYLLLAIGIKGGIELQHTQIVSVLIPGLVTILLGALITIIAYSILSKVLHFTITDSIAIATHYGSVSAVTYAIVSSFLNQKNQIYEEYSTVLLVLLEIPAIITGALLVQFLVNRKETKTDFKKVFSEVFLGKSILLLLGGLLIGYYMSLVGNLKLNFFFKDLFQGFLAIFLLEMGVVTGSQLQSLKKVGISLILFGIIMPLISAFLGFGAAKLAGLSMGGAIILATMASSASYIAAPTAIKMLLPQANATYYMTAALGITFPFNVIFGIPLYYKVINYLY